MAPRQDFETRSSPVTRSFKPVEKAQDVPVTTSSSEVKNEEEQGPVTKDVPNEPVPEVKDEVKSSEAISSEVSDDMSPDGEDPSTTVEAVSSSFLDRAEEYLSSFRISQFGIRLAETGLAVVEKPFALMSTGMSSKIQSSRRHLRYARRAGLRRAGDGGCRSRSLLLQLIHVFRLNFLFGVLGIKVVEADIEPVTSSKTKDVSVGEDNSEVDEDSEEDPDYVFSSDSEDSLEYRSDTDLEDSLDQEYIDIDEISETSSSEEADDECNTPACSKAEHTKVAEVEEAGDNE